MNESLFSKRPRATRWIGLTALLVALPANAATRSFEQPFLFADPSRTSGWSVSGDVNLDGHLDLVMFGSNATVLDGDGTGSFVSVQTFSVSEDKALGDVNGDAYPDLVGPSLVKLNNGDGTFGPE